MAERCAGISNNGIQWDGTDAGVWPWVVGESERWLLEAKCDPTTLLFQALEDPDRWVAAHVLLTRRSFGKPFVANSGSYNGLRVTLLADGSVQIDPEQRARIRKQWLDVLGVGSFGDTHHYAP